MTTVRAVLLRCDECGEIFDTGARSVRAAVAASRGEGWERTRTPEVTDRCGICTGRFVRAGEFLIRAEEIQPQCCCQWGAAVGRFSVPGVKGNIPSGESPEFDCSDCPKHGDGTHPHRCKRHRRAAARSSP